jgi:two-component system cell cycle response regulator
LLLKPGDDKLLLARMRSILRLSEMEEDLSLREHEHRALGLAEDPEQFTAPGRVAILAADMKTAVRWQSRIAPHTAARIQPSGFRDAIRHAGNTVRPDVLVLMLTSQSREAGLQVLADLRAKTETRDCGIIAVVEGEHAPKIAAEALDIGANDVVAEPAEAAEIALRIARQTMRKRRIKRLREDLRDGLRAAMTDPLTGLYNRRYAIPRLTQIAAEAEKYSRNYAVMIIDIDHFKLINDQFGHSAGDSVLIRVANVLKSALGTQGILARIGGDEFMVTLPNAGPHEAQLMAKRLCRAVRESCRPTAGSNRALQATVSIGVAMASAPAPAPQGDLPALWQSPELTLEQADRALYRAKARGRNRVSLGAARSAA